MPWVAKEDTHSDTLCKAINLCTEILDTPNLGLAWKFKALTQRAQFYERMNEQKKALDDYASILAHTPSGSSANKRRDWHWFYNAGFASIRLLGQLQDWDGALALAKKLAQTPAPEPGKQRLTARRTSWNISFGRMNGSLRAGKRKAGNTGSNCGLRNLSSCHGYPPHSKKLETQRSSHHHGR